MVVYAIADLHLPADGDKPMDVFGAHWERHFERICEDWQARVSDDDLVLMPGDISWAMRLNDAKPDLDAIGRLAGVKVLTRGNHDYWWSSISRVREALPNGTYAIQNDALFINGCLIAGTRGWILPAEGVADDDKRIFEREVLRLSMSLKRARALDGRAPLVCMLHYPPITDSMRENALTRLFGDYGVSHVVYGHLHGSSLYGAFRGTSDGVCYHQVSCDGTDFKLHRVCEI